MKGSTFFHLSLITYHYFFVALHPIYDLTPRRILGQGGGAIDKTAVLG